MTRPFHLPILLGLVFLYQSCGYQQDTGSNQLISDPYKLDKYLTKLTEIGAYPFIYARLEDDKGDVIYEHGSVNEDVLPGKKVDGQTWIRIWSMSKIVTISIALDLVEDGLLSLNDPVTKYIPEFKNLQVATSKSGGGFVGVLNGLEFIPRHLTTDMGGGEVWIEPFNNQYINYSRDKLPNMTPISEIIDRIYAMAEIAILENGGKKLRDNGAVILQIPVK